MTTSQSRVFGSGFTVMRWQATPIAFLQGFNDTGQRPVAEIEPVQGIDDKYPIEFAVPRAMRGGAFSATIKELWSMPVWQHLKGFEAAKNLLDVWEAMAVMPGTITAQLIIKPPRGNYWRVKTYHNIAVAAIDDSERITIGSMTLDRDINCVYTHATYDTVTAGT